MKKNINIEDVKDFIREYGYIYGIDIQEELDKVKASGIPKEDILREFNKNKELYKELADM